MNLNLTCCESFFIMLHKQLHSSFSRAELTVLRQTFFELIYIFCFPP